MLLQIFSLHQCYISKRKKNDLSEKHVFELRSIVKMLDADLYTYTIINNVFILIHLIFRRGRCRRL